MKNTIEKARHNMLQATSEGKHRVKLYKAGRLWLAAGMTTVALGLVSMASTVRVSADDTTPTTATESSTSSSNMQQSQVTLDSSSSADSSSESTAAEPSSSVDADSGEASTSQSASSNNNTAASRGTDTKISDADSAETGTTDSKSTTNTSDKKTTTDNTQTVTADSSSTPTASESSDSQSSDESSSTVEVTTGVKSDAVNADTNSSSNVVSDNEDKVTSGSDIQTSTDTGNESTDSKVNETDLGVTDDATLEAAKALAAQEYADTGVAQIVTAQLAAAKSTDTTETTDTDSDDETTQNGITYQGFSVTDPVYPDDVKQISDADQYLYFELAYGTPGNFTNYVALSTDRDSAETTTATVMDSTGKVINTQVLTTSDTGTKITDGTTSKTSTINSAGLTITDTAGADTLYVKSSTSYYILTNVLGELDGYYGDGQTTLTAVTGVAVFKPQKLTQVTTFQKQDGTEVVPTYTQSGLTGQAYTTGTPVDNPTGYTPKDSSNSSGYMSPFTTDSTLATSSVTITVPYTIKNAISSVSPSIVAGSQVNDTITLTFNSDGSATMTVNYGSNYTNVPSAWRTADAVTSTIAYGAKGVIQYNPSSTTDGTYHIANPYLPQTSDVTYTYVADSEDVVVNFLNQNNEKIAPSQTVSGSYDSSVDLSSVESTAITGYTLNTDSAKTFKVESTDSAKNVVNLYYTLSTPQGTLTIIDAATGKVLGSQTVTGVTGGHVDESEYAKLEQSVINKGYTPNSDLLKDSTVMTGVFTADGGDEFTLKVTKPTATVSYTVNYTTSDGQTIKSITKTGTPGETIQLTPPDGYVWTPGANGQITLNDKIDNNYDVAVTTPKNTIGDSQFGSANADPVFVTAADYYDNTVPKNVGATAENDLGSTPITTPTDTIDSTNGGVNSKHVAITTSSVTEGVIETPSSTSNAITNVNAKADTKTLGDITESNTEDSEGQNDLVKKSNGTPQDSTSSSTSNNEASKSHQSASHKQVTLPQTNESQNTAEAAGFIGLVTALLGLFGFKKRKHGEN